jgi:biotin carboxyl carrier protein
MTDTTSLVVEIEGHRFELTASEWKDLDCIQVDTNTYHLLENGKAHTIVLIAADPASRTYTLKIDGEIKETILLTDLDLLIEKMGLNSTQSKKLSVLHAPMPGLVTGIKVTAGQEVEKGTPLIILEAMKMENMIVAPQHGVIKNIKVSVGQAVEKGAVLIEFDA